MIPGQRFVEPTGDFWAYGAGAWCWRRYAPLHPDRDVNDTIDEEHPDGNGHSRALLVVVPAPRFESGVELIRVLPYHAPGNWARPGTVCGWDGNIEEPTLHPSLDRTIEGAGGWHGWFRRGNIE